VIISAEGFESVMINDLLKTGASLPLHSAGEKESLHRQASNEYGDEFAVVLAQVSGQEDMGPDVKSLDRTVYENDAEQTTSRENVDTDRPASTEPQAIKPEKDSVKSGHEVGEVVHKTAGKNQKPPAGMRLRALTDRLSDMSGARRIENPEPIVENNAALNHVDSKKLKEKTAALKKLLWSSPQGKEVKVALHRQTVKIDHDTVIQNLQSRTVEDRTGVQFRSAKIKILRNMLQAPDKGMPSNLYEATPDLKHGPEKPFSAHARTVADGLQEAVLSKYEGSVKTIDMKPHYHNVQNGDGLFADGNFDEIVRQFTLLMRKGGGEAKLLLQPEHLGSLKLRIQVDSGEVATSILVDNQAVKDLILSRLNILEESLLEKGFDLSSFDVGVKSENGDAETALGTTAGKKSGHSVVESIPMEDEVAAAGETAKLPWMSTRVNITV
jgi:flagellar hook-length control protein FliK